MKRIALIDGNSLINRAYYAMRNPMITKDGIYTQGIFGFLNMMDKIRKDYEPEYMAIAFDMKAPTFRHKQYDEYKAGRRKMPPELAMEIPILKDILDAMKIRRVELEGYEADDIIGTLARMSEAEGLETFVFTGDRDQLQLATDVTKIVYTKRGVSDFDLFDHDAFCEAYGFTPLQFIDYKGLAGDSSDNIPGIPGVGAKTATKLIQQFGSVEELIANADDVKPAGLQAKVKDNAQQAMMSKRLATIMTQVPLEISVEDCLLEEPDYDALIDIYKKLEFNKFLSRLKVKQSGGESASEDVPPEVSEAMLDRDRIHRIPVSDAGALEGLHISGPTVLKVFGDGSHTDMPQIDSIAILNDGRYLFVRPEAFDAFGDWMKREMTAEKPPRFLGHDIKDSYYMLKCRFGLAGFQTEFDTAVAQYVLDSGRSGYSLSALSNEYLHMTLEEEKDFVAAGAQMDMFSDGLSVYDDYGFAYCATVFDLHTLQKAEISAQKMEKVLYEVELPLIDVIADMEKEGFRTDSAFLSSFGEDLTGTIDQLAASIHEMAGEEFNINSTQQLGDILFEKLALQHGKKTKKGYSTSAEVLEKIRGDHPIVPAILEYRSLTKLKSTYVDGLIPLISTDGKIHAHFQQTVAATGRLSCTEPNLQNIPIRQELGRQLRKAFVPETEDCLLIGADYSQIELRVLAHMSGDRALIDAFNRGEDIHRATAANVLGIPEDEITPEERSRAKAVNFGVIYGMSAFGLSGELDITRKEADEYIQAYFDKHQQVRQFMDDAVAFAKAEGYVATLLGRKRYIKEINASNYMVRQIGERLAMNSPIQGTAADIIKIAMIKVRDALTAAGLKSKLILQIHDELVINTYPDEKDIVKKLLVDNMESAYDMAVELKADLNKGKNWYELK